jgi:hypothetical protein
MVLHWPKLLNHIINQEYEVEVNHFLPCRFDLFRLDVAIQNNTFIEHPNLCELCASSGLFALKCFEFLSGLFFDDRHLIIRLGW